MPKKSRDVLSAMIARVVSSVMHKVERMPQWEAQRLLLGKALSLQTRSIAEIGSLRDIEFQIFSQWGEDGIIEWVIHNLPNIPESFVEFGMEDYFESNTRFLLMNRNWRGLVVDSSEENIASVKQRPWFWKYDLTAVAEFITAENVDTLLQRHGYSGDIGVLSIDIDGNDYWVLEAMTCAKPWVIVAEYNPVLGDLWPITVPYCSDFVCERERGGNLYFGASLAALEVWSSKAGYELLGTDGAGCNAFFVRNDVGDALLDKIRDRRGRPALFRTSRSPDGTLLLLSGSEQLELLHGLPFVDVVSHEEMTVGDTQHMYSDCWSSSP